jgi:ABC-type branched-subunit amino acid transport system ATPase component
MQAIEIRGVTKSFGGLRAVDDVTLSVPAGSTYGFIGPNGSGKTTTLRMILNILLSDRAVAAGRRNRADDRDDGALRLGGRTDFPSRLARAGKVRQLCTNAAVGPGRLTSKNQISAVARRW